MRNKWIEKYCDKIRVKKLSDGEVRHYYYIEGKRIEYKKIDTDFVRVYGKLLKFMKEKTQSGKVEDGFLVDNFKKFFTKQYNFSNFYCVNKDFLNDLNNEGNLFHKPKVFRSNRPIYYYDVSNCYPTLFYLCTGNLELYELLNTLDKEKRLKVLGALAYTETVYVRDGEYFKLVKDEEWGGKYYYAFTTIVNVLNEIMKVLVSNHKDILYTYCDSFLTQTDYSDLFEVDIFDKKILFKKKNEYILHKVRELENVIIFELLNKQDNTKKIHTLSKNCVNLF